MMKVGLALRPFVVEPVTGATVVKVESCVMLPKVELVQPESLKHAIMLLVSLVPFAAVIVSAVVPVLAA